MLLTPEQVPAIRSIAGGVFVFHEDNASAHHARDTPQFISPDIGQT